MWGSVDGEISFGILEKDIKGEAMPLTMPEKIRTVLVGRYFALYVSVEGNVYQTGSSYLINNYSPHDISKLDLKDIVGGCCGETSIFW